MTLTLICEGRYDGLDLDIYSYIEFGPYDGFDKYDKPDEGLDLDMMTQMKASKVLAK